jgi:hypothetical protein
MISNMCFGTSEMLNHVIIFLPQNCTLQVNSLLILRREIWSWVKILCLFTGGFDLLGRTKDQIRSLQQVNDAKIACQTLKLDGLVLVGGKSWQPLSEFQLFSQARKWDLNVFTFEYLWQILVNTQKSSPLWCYTPSLSSEEVTEHTLFIQLSTSVFWHTLRQVIKSSLVCNLDITMG